MYKIGVIGDRGSILGFKAVGMEVFPCSNASEARKTLYRIAGEHYAIIYITENLCKDMGTEIDKYRDAGIPAIIPIPGMDGSCGIGMDNLKKAVEKAVGADILFGNE